MWFLSATNGGAKLRSVRGTIFHHLRIWGRLATTPAPFRATCLLACGANGFFFAADSGANRALRGRDSHNTNGGEDKRGGVPCIRLDERTKGFEEIASLVTY
ncbi:hypothetical protein Agabi119p4_2603 [Agaricus bisporus var. burnettii]|uniref:Uncharacterized protein n=1 Tax=Agaricus bisporus var. burnettii TaxID=192524 RepID=A0A8H7KKC0_AGABI|nr:hypothetical protein Agabi119p4_2603 [Agaricus bisporus var. burnettii]